jgi:hypothetical protein
MLLLHAWTAAADDVAVRPAPGDGLVVTDTTGTTERLRVDEDGPVLLPGLAAHPSPDRCLCTDTATGRVGTCALQAEGPQGPPGPPGPPGTPGPSIIDRCAIGAFQCDNTANQPGCPADFVLEAICPPGYVRLALIQCKIPDSPDLHASLHVDPYNPDRLGCRYTGVVESGPFTEELTAHIWCIAAPAVPCFEP